MSIPEYKKVKMMSDALMKEAGNLRYLTNNKAADAIDVYLTEADDDSLIRLFDILAAAQED